MLVALRMKGETVDEIAAAAEVMRELSSKVEVQHTDHLIDTCGTGGDGAQTFNISTASALVAAAAGAHVAKHGGRSGSSKGGLAGVLEELGVKRNGRFGEGTENFRLQPGKDLLPPRAPGR